jgi:hypothetical protein
MHENDGQKSDVIKNIRNEFSDKNKAHCRYKILRFVTSKLACSNNKQKFVPQTHFNVSPYDGASLWFCAGLGAQHTWVIVLTISRVRGQRFHICNGFLENASDFNVGRSECALSECDLDYMEYVAKKPWKSFRFIFNVSIRGCLRKYGDIKVEIKKKRAFCFFRQPLSVS